MSGRTLGGGRILGSGKGLAPPTPPASNGIPHPQRSVSPFAPRSESTVSIGSVSMSPPATGSSPDAFFSQQDLGSSISVGATSKGAAADSSALVCPICNEEMMTLLQLNRHIDDNHQELPEEEQDEVKTWFDKQVSKAKRFQPLSLINQKLRGLEVFESNEISPAPVPHHGPVAAGKLPLEGAVDPDELITRKHWQRTTMDDHCTDPACGRNLGPITGSINCRHCGLLFCEEHTMYQMKLSRSAKHEPVRGYWARVCETCYKSREGYNDHNGLVVDHTSAFAAIRRERVERHTLEVSRLEKRLTKLTQILANPPERLASNGSILSPVTNLAGQKNTRKLLEQSVVTWEDDSTVPKCPWCQQEFGSWTFRRHHCRICGRVVCADPQTACSSEVGLSVAAGGKNGSTEKSESTVGIDVRMCRDCKHTIFSSREFAVSLAHKPPDQRAYETLRQFERGIRSLLPTFHRTLLALQPQTTSSGEVDLSKPPPTHAQIQEAAKIRKRLVDSFSKYGLAAKRMRDLEGGPQQKKLQMGVYTYASSFLHVNMLPLKSLPSLLRSSSRTSQPARLMSPSGNGPSGLRHSQVATPSDLQSDVSEDQASTIVSTLESEEKTLRERLVVLEEQKFMVEEMLRGATKGRRFEEISALTRNQEELDAEISDVRGKVGELEDRFAGVYTDAG
ncbi:Vacuolar segregation protein-like protein [Emericellopsis cladophorae]|uniref:Vacuolar segregation protein-like protein n=1 Tax=Emericellopsis cladophorae TaxID=2686198 RepID=A0A9P9Y8N7_9HYPO|nr:Vacuolar segregation protein-like protein [Emericellopsis cladophorae]KAI6785506.1 Vacuolar segregation protein-like protein [Emericellopsis cladophorae]